MITCKSVSCVNRQSIPEENEKIDEIFDMRNLPLVESVDIYYRDKIACPFGRGNWMIDINFKGGAVCAIKLPKEMREEDVYDYAKPLLESICKKH